MSCCPRIFTSTLLFFLLWCFSLYFFILFEIPSQHTHTHNKKDFKSLLPSHKLAHSSSSWDQLQWRCQSLGRQRCPSPLHTRGRTVLSCHLLFIDSSAGLWSLRSRAWEDLALEMKRACRDFGRCPKNTRLHIALPFLACAPHPVLGTLRPSCLRVSVRVSVGRLPCLRGHEGLQPGLEPQFPCLLT